MVEDREIVFSRIKGLPPQSPVKIYREVLPLENFDFSLPVTLVLHRKLVHGFSPILFLVNGFSADHKTFTFRPLREKGAFAPSFAEFMAEQGFVVVVKSLRSERVFYERSFADYVELVPEYTKAVLEHIPPLVKNILGIRLKAEGVHWIGHSLGGMVAAATPVKEGLLSLTTIGSPTYMYLDNQRLLQWCRMLRPLFPFAFVNKRLRVPTTLAERFLDYMFTRFGIESDRKLSHDQYLKIGLLLHLPFVRILAHTVLNLDHIDFETAAAFMRSATADENFQLLLDFVDGLLINGKDKSAILKQPLIPFKVPTLVIGGEGDDIAPAHSVVHLLRFVQGARKEKVIFKHYDHLGLLLKYAARFDVWPVIVAFIYEQAVRQTRSERLRQQGIKAILALVEDKRLGSKALRFSRKVLRSLRSQQKRSASRSPFRIFASRKQA